MKINYKFSGDIMINKCTKILCSSVALALSAALLLCGCASNKSEGSDSSDEAYSDFSAVSGSYVYSDELSKASDSDDSESTGADSAVWSHFRRVPMLRLTASMMTGCFFAKTSG
jgi:hypothetical protein